MKNFALNRSHHRPLSRQKNEVDAMHGPLIIPNGLQVLTIVLELIQGPLAFTLLQSDRRLLVGDFVVFIPGYILNIITRVWPEHCSEMVSLI
jgi:hypothetical protein